jgi:hypothetical protein
MFVEVLEVDFSRVAHAVQTAMPAGAPLRLDEVFIDALPAGGFAPPLGAWPQDRIDTAAPWRGMSGDTGSGLSGFAGFDVLSALPQLESIAGIAAIAPI